MGQLEGRVRHEAAHAGLGTVALSNLQSSEAYWFKSAKNQAENILN